jgi:hypothetical protein
MKQESILSSDFSGFHYFSWSSRLLWAAVKDGLRTKIISAAKAAGSPGPILLSPWSPPSLQGAVSSLGFFVGSTDGGLFPLTSTVAKCSRMCLFFWLHMEFPGLQLIAWDGG